MARGRMINGSVARDKKLNSLSLEAHLAFLMTIPHLDRDGRIGGDPWLLFTDVLPLRRSFEERMPAIIEEWIAAGLAVRYGPPDESVLWFPGFRKNQTGMVYNREPVSKYPAPPEPTTDTTQADTCSLHADYMQTACNGQPEVEEKLSRSATPAAAADPITAFTNTYKSTWALLPASDYEAGKIKDWANRVPLEAWEYALRECVDHHNTGQWKYLESILKRVEKDGLPQVSPAVAATPVANGKIAGFSMSKAIGG